MLSSANAPGLILAMGKLAKYNIQIVLISIFYFSRYQYLMLIGFHAWR
jgi:hypothetical protein